MAKHIDDITSYSAMNNDDEKMTVIAYLKKKYDGLRQVPREYVAAETLDRYQKLPMDKYLDMDDFASITADMIIGVTPNYKLKARDTYLTRINGKGPWLSYEEAGKIIGMKASSLNSTLCTAATNGMSEITTRNGYKVERKVAHDC